MPTNKKIAALVICTALTFGAGGAASAAAVLKAEYLFNNTFSATGGGAPALVPVDPLGANAFETQTVFGSPRVVYDTDGNSTPAQQAGLSLDTTGLVTPSSYSVEMVFEFDSNSGWRRIVDVQNRQSDDGFYVDPNSHLDVFPVVGGTTFFTANVFHHVVLTDSGGTVNGYLDGNLEFSTSTAVMDVNNPGNLMNFYLDNVVGGGQGEFSDADTALIRLYDGALTGAQVAALARNPFGVAPVPEPATLALLGMGLAGLSFTRRRKRD